jgi:hypothetical protein
MLASRATRATSLSADAQCPRVVLVAGAPGSGKSSVLSQIASAAHTRFETVEQPDRVCSSWCLKYMAGVLIVEGDREASSGTRGGCCRP